VLAALIGLVAVIVASGGGGGDGGASETRLLDSIPDSVQKNCEQPGNSWMKRHGAVEQQKCDPLPSGVPVGDLAYGLFPSADEAQAFVEKEAQDEQRPCEKGATALLNHDYPGGNAECYKNPNGIIIRWAERESGVAVQLNFYPGPSVPEAVDARRKLLP
jgi:hypothetical protein